MTMLARTRRLVMAPSSNPPQAMDAAWVFLLPKHADVLWLGEGTEAIEAVTQIGGRVSVLGHGDEVALGGPFDAVVVQSDDPTWVKSMYAEALTKTKPTCVFVRLPGSAPLPGNHTWISIGRAKKSKTLKRIERVATLGLARLSQALPMIPTARVRKHASDVPFVRLPGDLTKKPRVDETSLALPAPNPPGYLMEMGIAHGVTFDPNQWSFGPPRGFASQKVIFGLGGEDRKQDLIVKLTQHQRFNERLMAEANALRLLHGKPGLAFRVPQVLFSDQYESLAVLCETRLTGSPMRTVLSRTPDDTVARSGFEAIVSLSASTIQTASAGETRHAMSTLADDLINIYPLPDAVSSEISAVADRAGQFDLPSVYMHGDMGVWNMLAGPDDQVGILDWENFDEAGIPLWDLFVYARTLGVFLADASGTRYTTAVFTRQLLGESDLRRTLFSHIKEYLALTELPAEVVDDLFVMCWVQQAVREAASQLQPAWLASRATQLLAASLANPLGFRG